MTPQAPKKASLQDWPPEKIKYVLATNGYTLRDIAREEGLKAATTLSRAMHTSYPAMERRLAKYAKVPVQVMFPSRYYPDGTPVPRGIRGARQILKSTLAGAACNGNVEEAA